MSIAEVKDVIQDVFSTAEQDLDADEIIGKLFSARIIDIQKYEAIQEKETTRDKNRVLLQHLYKAADVKMLTRFCDILDDTTRPKHKTLGRCIRTKLQSIQSNSTCVLLHSGRYYAYITLIIVTLWCVNFMPYCMFPLPLVMVKRMRKKRTREKNMRKKRMRKKRMSKFI